MITAFRFTIAVSLVLAACAVPAGAAAYEKLAFRNEVTGLSRSIIHDYIRKDLQKTPDSIVITTTDLNGDGLDEFILREKICAKSAPCEFYILAENKNRAIHLGTITAHDIALGNGVSDGIRDILAFQNANNAFDYTVYVWEPLKARYATSKPVP